MKISLMAVVAGFCLVVGLPLAATAGPTPGGPSAADGDGVEDFFDNCYLDNNPEQKDFDHDGCGNLCDYDADNNGIANAIDLGNFRTSYLKSQGDPAYNGNFDTDCNGVVNAVDLGNFRANYLQPTGPSGFPAAQRSAGCPGPN
jgi:hypothetical protein